MTSRCRQGRIAALVLILASVFAAPVIGQSLDERLDEEAFLRGLIELELPDLLEHYIRTHAGDDPVRETQFRIAAERIRMREANTSTEQRLAALERILARRAELIESHRGDPRRGTWLTDQCADLLFELLPTDESGLTTLFGLPSDEQRRRANRVAREMNELSALAEIEIDRAIFDLESRPGFRSDEALQAQRRRLVREERDRRVPFMRGVGAFLHAELNVDRGADRQDLYETAVRSLEPVVDRLDGPLAARARAYYGLALARLGRFDDAETQFRAAATNQDALETDVFAARMGGTLSREINRGPEVALRALDSIEERYEAPDALLFRVLIADRRFLLLRRIAEALDVEARQKALSDAFDGYLALLDQDASIPRRAVRAVVFDRLVRAADRELPLDRMPAIVTVARADRLAREAGSRDEAIALLRSVEDRPDAGASDRAAALFMLGRVLFASNRPLDAAETFLDLAESYPRDVEAERAVELAASLATEAARTDPEDRRAAAMQRRALEVLLTRYPSLPSINRWRYEAGRAAMRDGDNARAAELFAFVATGSPLFIDAQCLRISALRGTIEGAGSNSDTAARARELLAEIERVENLIRAKLEKAEGTRRADLHYYLASLTVQRAFAQLRLYEPERALATLDEMTGAAETDSHLLAEVLHLRIEANRALGRAEQARKAVDRLFETDPIEGGRIVRSLVEEIERRVQTMLDDGRDDEARRLAENEMLPLIERLEPRVDSLSTGASARVALLAAIADGYRLAGRYDAGLRAYERLDRAAPETIEVLFGRAECLFGLDDGDLAEAMSLYRRIAASGVSADRSRYYWQSQVRMLEILDRVGKNTDQIMPRIRRLELQDPELGGLRYRRQFERLTLKYGSGRG
jgi:tetratricopeptide (TPR) repeat protein